MTPAGKTTPKKPTEQDILDILTKATQVNSFSQLEKATGWSRKFVTDVCRKHGIEYGNKGGRASLPTVPQPHPADGGGARMVPAPSTKAVDQGALHLKLVEQEALKAASAQTVEDAKDFAGMHLALVRNVGNRVVAKWLPIASAHGMEAVEWVNTACQWFLEHGKQVQELVEEVAILEALCIKLLEDKSEAHRDTLTISILAAESGVDIEKVEKLMRTVTGYGSS